MPKKLEAQQRQFARVGKATPAHQVPPDLVVKPMKLGMQQQQRAHREPSGHVGKPKKLGVQQR